MDQSLYFSQNPLQLTTKPFHVASLFFENSTRTRCSFEIATHNLGHHFLHFPIESSSLKKGETLLDTLKMLAMMGTKAAIIRHSDNSLLHEITPHSPLSLINAGSGTRHHPTQALLDMMTIYQEKKTLDNLHIVICGDIKHSRVAKSHIDLWKNFNSQISFCGPSALQINDSQDFSTALKTADVVIMLRMQFERHEMLNIDTAHYNQHFGLNAHNVDLLKKDAIILHPGPYNIGIEITQDIVNHPKSRILKQVENGVYMRMSVLDFLLKE